MSSAEASRTPSAEGPARSTAGTATGSESGRRLSSDERRRQILEAAMAVFGAKGYEGATTDQVAQAAGVSQPYVVRLFGSKENLFLATLDDATERLLRSFQAAVARGHEAGEPAARFVGEAYIDLISVRGLHQTLAHSYLLGGHPVIGPAARRRFTEVWRFVRDEMGVDADEARVFMSTGLLISTIIGLRIADEFDSDPQVAELLRSCFPGKLDHVLKVLPRGGERW